MTRRAPLGKRTPARGASGVVYPISLCMIVRNEERFLHDCLASVQGIVDEIKAKRARGEPLIPPIAISESP